jgi:hypothetical protein
MSTPTDHPTTDLHDRVRAALCEEQWQLVRELLELNDRGWAASVDREAGSMADHIARAFPDREDAIRAVGRAFVESGGHERCMGEPGRRFHP